MSGSTSRSREPALPELLPPAEPELRWQALFQRSRDAVFVLNRRRTFLFVNRAWEQLTGVSAAEARGLACRRRTLLPQDPADLVVRTLCCPPAHVLKGSSGRSRRLARRGSLQERWWDIDFLPLRDDRGTLCILGRIEPAPISSPAPFPPLPERLVSLREEMRQRFNLDRLVSRLPA